MTNSEMINSDKLIEEYGKIIDCDKCIQQRCNRILRDKSNLPQPGFIGKNYSKHRVIFVPQNPGYAKPNRTFQHQRYAEAEEMFVGNRTVRTMTNLLASLEKAIPYWTIYDKEIYPLLARCKLTLADIAYFNGIRCPTKGNTKPSDIMLTSCIIHLENWLNWLKPKVVICVGKWIYKEVSPLLASHKIPHTFVNRDRSLSAIKKAQNFDKVSQFIQAALQSPEIHSKHDTNIGRATLYALKAETDRQKSIVRKQKAHKVSTRYKVGEIVSYRGKTGRVIEALRNDKGYRAVRNELKSRCGPGQWVSNLGIGGKGLSGDGGEMYRLERV